MPPIVSHALASGHDRNLFLLFRNRFEIETPESSVSESSVLHIFADTRYRLTVNGTILGYGPNRFYPTAPEFDSYNLAPLLKAGMNEIRVEVNSRNSSSFQAVPSQPGFWAQGCAGENDLSTPNTWQVKISEARSSEAPTFSFAQGPVEITDVAVISAEWDAENGWEMPVIASGWGEIQPRSVPMQPFLMRDGGKLLLKASLKNEEERIVFGRSFPTGDGPFDRTRQFAVTLSLFSPVAQTIHLGLFWGKNYLNGELLELQNDEVRGNRQNAVAHFQAGWNLFYAQIDVVQPSWGFLIGWPHAANLRTGPEGLRVSDILTIEDLEALRGPLPTTPNALENADWLYPIANGPHCDFPAREVAWDVPDEVAANSDETSDLLVSETGGAGVEIWDFEREFLGHVRLHVETEKGAIIDVVVDERRRSDGMIALYASHPFVNSADRFIVPAGKSVVELFHPRGGRFVQVTARSEGSVKVTELKERSSLLHLEKVGKFECSDPLLNQIWRTGVATIEACLPDVWIDCPWREQGAYLGDTLVEFQATRTLSSHLEMGRRALQLWAQGQRPDGLTPACVPAWYDSPHADFSLFYVLLLRDFWTHSSDTALVRELWPTIQNIFTSPLWESDANGLWTATSELRLFFDWGIPLNERLGKANGALNALRVGALYAASELALVIGEDGATWKEEANQMTAAFRRVLWRERTQDFAPFAGESDSPSHHANVLALRFGLASPEQIPGVLQNLQVAHGRLQNLGDLRRNDGHLELFFIHFLLEALASHGWHQEALSWIREAWSPMVETGAINFWECLHTGLKGNGSLCHAWSCSPNWFFTREILGVRPIAGQPNAFQIVPNPVGLEWARGIYPHPLGPIEVAWRHEKELLQIEVSAPKGVEIEGYTNSTLRSAK